ncbi:MAG: secondary thiamine-phosphate synthase enzyme YjbQ [Patescibacteria group bacterium]|jgi:secondary thiamine-phosphate synthase enzyme
METFTVNTNQKDEVVDITEKINKKIKDMNIREGMCLVFVHHTTCCLTTADLDPGTEQDMLEALRGVLPKVSYRHPHDPSHTPDHILSSIIGPSVMVPVQDTSLVLGAWQKVVLVEFNGPKKRTVSLTVVEEKN